MMDKIIANSIRNSGDKRVGLWLGILVFMRSQPCYLWAFEDLLRPLCSMLIMILCVVNISHEKWTKWIFLSIASAYIWASVFVDHTSIVTTFNFLAFAFIPILRKEVVLETYKVFYKIVTFFLALSIINYILFQLGINFGGINIPPLNELKSYTYIMYPFLVVPSVPTLRFLGIFDEPGVVGTLCALILVAEKMNFTKKGNIIILVAGILSLSMFFYAAMAMSVIMFISNNRQRIICVMAILAFILLTYSNSAIYDKLWGRFEFDSSTGTFAGDNRSGGTLGVYFFLIMGSPIFYLGHGGKFVEQFQGEASLLLIIIKYGFIFVFFNLLGYALLAFREIEYKKKWLFFMLFFLATIYQRPGFTNTFSIFLYTMVIYSYASNISCSKKS